MDDESLHHGKVEFERQDLGARGILEFFAGLVIMGVVVALILLGMFHVMDRYQQAHQPEQNPLVKVTEADTRRVTSGEVDSFAQPQLETNEIGQLSGQRLREEEVLNTYGWVDQKAGVARIPIDRAMALMAQRGLPTEPSGAVNPGKRKQQGGAASGTKKGRARAAAKQ
jgi:hypothetical protein